MIHRNYARLNAADRRVVDDAYRAVVRTMEDSDRKTDNGDTAERLVEMIATYMIESGGAARVGSGRNFTAPVSEEHSSYGA